MQIIDIQEKDYNNNIKKIKIKQSYFKQNNN